MYTRNYKSISVKVVKHEDGTIEKKKKDGENEYRALASKVADVIVTRKWFGLKKTVRLEPKIVDGCEIRLQYHGKEYWVRNLKSGAEMFATIIREEQYQAQLDAQPKPGLFRRLATALIG